MYNIDLCSHTITVILHQFENPMNYIHELLKRSAFDLAYRSIILLKVNTLFQALSIGTLLKLIVPLRLFFHLKVEYKGVDI